MTESENTALSRKQLYAAYIAIGLAIVAIVAALFPEIRNLFIPKIEVNQVRLFSYQFRNSKEVDVQQLANESLLDSLGAIPAIESRQYSQMNTFSRQAGHRLYLEIAMSHLPTGREFDCSAYVTCDFPSKHPILGDRYTGIFKRRITLSYSSSKLVVPFDMVGKDLQSWMPGKYQAVVVIDGFGVSKHERIDFVIE